MYGAHDLRLETIPDPCGPGPGEVVVRITAAGICGSDLHTYLDGRIGDTVVEHPVVPCHECAGVIESAGPDARAGDGAALVPGGRVAVDPAIPCNSCEWCNRGDPNLCVELRFFGLPPENGCLQERVRVPARCCFPLPDSIDDASGALLEPLGVALHAADLAHLRPGRTVAVLGAGPIGLLIVQTARIAGGGPVYVSEPLPWRRNLAEQAGGVLLDADDPAGDLLHHTNGRGVDAVFEAAWGGSAIEQAAAMACPGGTLVLVGIPGDDRCILRHSVARRKGLTLRFCRRMKFTYPRAIRLVEEGHIQPGILVSHTFPLAQAAAAFMMNAAYAPGVLKTIIRVTS
jgi:L-iditol 2-dehydrogenase